LAAHPPDGGIKEQHLEHDVQQACHPEIEAAQGGGTRQLDERCISRGTLPRIERAAWVERVLQVSHILRREVDLRKVGADAVDGLPRLCDAAVRDPERMVDGPDQQLVGGGIAVDQVHAHQH
jgi:hypothetical protein